MAFGPLVKVLPRLRDASLAPHEAVGDAELLERFVSGRDEVAFEIILRRHAPMVFAVCRRVLRHTQDAEDAFQATFLVLAHKAATVSPRSNLAAWLHGVAHNTALKARHRAAHRREVEKRVLSRSQDEMHTDATRPEVEAILDQEIAGLPDRYRLPIILCDLEGRTRVAVARTLRCSEGTLSSRLTRGRRLLAERLKRRGIALPLAAIAPILSGPSPVLAQSLILATVPVVLSSLAVPAGVGGAASPSVAELATGVMKSMLLKKLQAAAFVVLAVATLIVTGLASYTGQAAPVPKAAPVPAGDGKAQVDTLADVDAGLLLNRKVLKEIKCDIDQLDRIMDLLEEAERKSQQKINEVMAGLVNGGNVNPQQFQQMMQDAQEAGEKEFRKAVGGVVANQLTPAQRGRLQQIDLQTRGHEAFAIPAVAKALDLTAKQKEQLVQNAKRIEDEITKVLNPPQAGVNFAGAAGGGGAVIGFATPTVDFEKVIREARAEGMKRALAVLTDDQKATWKQLVGEPFTHPVNLKRSHHTVHVGGVLAPAVGGLPGGDQVLPIIPPPPGQVVPPPVKN